MPFLFSKCISPAHIFRYTGGTVSPGIPRAFEATVQQQTFILLTLMSYSSRQGRRTVSDIQTANTWQKSESKKSKETKTNAYADNVHTVFVLACRLRYVSEKREGKGNSYRLPQRGEKTLGVSLQMEFNVLSAARV